MPNAAFHSSPQDDAKHDARREEVPVCLNHLPVCSCKHNNYEGIASGINAVSVLDQYIDARHHAVLDSYVFVEHSCDLATSSNG